MKFPYLVVHNGTEYQAGMEVPIDGIVCVKADLDSDVVTAKVETVIPFSDETVKGEIKISKTDINRMAINDLKALASKNKIKGFAEKSGAVLKKELIELLCN